MEIKKIVTVKLEELYNLKPLYSLLKKSIPLFSDYSNIKKPEDLLSYKIFGTTLSLRNNILNKVKGAVPTVKADVCEKLGKTREEEGTMLVVLHEMPSQFALLFLDKADFKYDYICHEGQKDSLKTLSFVDDGADMVEFGKETTSTKKKSTSSKTATVGKSKTVEEPKAEEKPKAESAPKKKSTAKTKAKETTPIEDKKSEPIDAPAVDIKIEKE